MCGAFRNKSSDQVTVPVPQSGVLLPCSSLSSSLLCIILIFTSMSLQTFLRVSAYESFPSLISQTRDSKWPVASLPSYWNIFASWLFEFQQNYFTLNLTNSSSPNSLIQNLSADLCVADVPFPSDTSSEKVEGLVLKETKLTPD